MSTLSRPTPKEQRELSGRTHEPLPLPRLLGFLRKSFLSAGARLEGLHLCEGAPFPTPVRRILLWGFVPGRLPAVPFLVDTPGRCTLPDSPWSPIYRARHAWPTPGSVVQSKPSLLHPPKRLCKGPAWSYQAQNCFRSHPGAPAGQSWEQRSLFLGVGPTQTLSVTSVIVHVN